MLLRMEQVEKWYQKKQVVKGLSLSVDAGQVYGIVGSNGAGKSTTAAMIATLQKPDAGRIFYQEYDIVREPRAIRAHMGYVPQEIALYEGLSGMENLRFFGQAYGVEKAQLTERIAEACACVSLDAADLKKPVRACSGGTKRKMNIAAALLHRPELLLLDEPTVGIDIDARNQILDAMRAIATEGKTVIFIGHYMDEIERVCDRVCIMEQGQCIAELDLRQSLEGAEGKPRLEELYLRHRGCFYGTVS